MRAAASRTFCTAGNSKPRSTAVMELTTSNSINVKAGRGTRWCMTELLWKDAGQRSVTIDEIVLPPEGKNDDRASWADRALAAFQEPPVYCSQATPVLSQCSINDTEKPHHFRVR